MSAAQSPKAPRMRQARKSIAHLPSLDVGEDKENATIDGITLAGLSARGKQTAKRSRSKSIGFGGLDALKEDAGNRRDVGKTDSTFDERERANEWSDNIASG